MHAADHTYVPDADTQFSVQLPIGQDGLQSLKGSSCGLYPSLHCVPWPVVTKNGAAKLTTLFHRQLRHITRQPAHLTHLSNQRLRAVYGLANSVHVVADRAAKQVRTTEALTLRLAARDARLEPVICQGEQRVAQTLRAVDTTSQSLRRTRPDLSTSALSANIKRGTRQRCANTACISTVITGKKWKQVDRLEHAKDGLPICRCCHHDFGTWQNLQRHIY